jgi:hypothetical protein
MILIRFAFGTLIAGVMLSILYASFSDLNRLERGPANEVKELVASPKSMSPIA